MERRKKRDGKFEKIVRALRACDPDIVEIVQFGSSVYAPRLARDLDLLVTTRAKKAEDKYWDAVAVWPKNVDVLVRETGEHISPNIALSVLAFSKTLFGNGVTRKEARRFMPIPSYEDARDLLTMADKDLELAHQERKEFMRVARYCLAFDLLFDAARHAAMAYLATDETRWGTLPRKLPKPFSTQFRVFIGKLHVEFSYDRKIPDKPDAAFKEWRAKVSKFIEELAARTQATGGKSK